MELQAYLEKYRRALNAELRDVMARHFSGSEDFRMMLEYHLGWVDETGTAVDRYPGKQVRPTLLLLCTELVGGDFEQALPAAAAIELIHNFSLIHDDIEDGSPLRRGSPTVWKLWGVPKAINVGDAMFALAYAGLGDLADRGAESGRVLAVLDVFTRTNLVLTAGQHLDMSFETAVDVSTDDYLHMIGGKSAALIRASAEIGALLGGADAEKVSRFAQFGEDLGMAFQIHDDVLGIWGDSEVMGKSAATDIVSRKKSLPVLYGLARSAELRKLYAQENVFSASQIEYAVAVLDGLGAREWALGYEQMYEGRLREFLGFVRDDPLGEVLSAFLFFLAGRAF